MLIDILTLFPGMFDGPFRESIVKRAIERGLVTIRIHNIRDWATDRHRTVDDYPYGGGAGMVLKPDVLIAAIEAVRGEDGYVILLTPQGRLFTQQVARELAQKPHLVLVCGHYEGVDERVRLLAVDDEISIGDYVLTGGELAAMVVVDATVRLLPGVLGDEASIREESHSSGLLEYPHYTRPPEFRGLRVPDVLLSGHHAQIARWRRREALRRTLERRPDLLAKAPLTAEDLKLLEEIRVEQQRQEQAQPEPRTSAPDNADRST
jgi:tRNA (guanine37-N1)-methyltransferase